MKHRHLVDDVGYSRAAVEDILERGGPEDWIALREAVRAEPNGLVARTVVAACDSSKLYGTSPLWKAWIRSLQITCDE